MVTSTFNGVRFRLELSGPTGGTPLVLANSLASNFSMRDAQIEVLAADALIAFLAGHP